MTAEQFDKWLSEVRAMRAVCEAADKHHQTYEQYKNGEVEWIEVGKARDEMLAALAVWKEASK